MHRPSNRECITLKLQWYRHLSKRKIILLIVVTAGVIWWNNTIKWSNQISSKHHKCTSYLKEINNK